MLIAVYILILPEEVSLETPTTSLTSGFAKPASSLCFSPEPSLAIAGSVIDLKQRG